MERGVNSKKRGGKGDKEAGGVGSLPWHSGSGQCWAAWDTCELQTALHATLDVQAGKGEWSGSGRTLALCASLWRRLAALRWRRRSWALPARDTATAAADSLPVVILRPCK